MSGRRTKFNRKVLDMMLAEVGDGAFDWLVAEAAGVSSRTFYRWMERGERGEEPFAGMAEQINKARAQTRIGAEQWVRRRDPLSWLRLGPGRSRPGRPGWAQPVKEPVDEIPKVEMEEEDPAVLEGIAEAMRETIEREEREGLGS
jgi:hypothetical protein